MYVKPTLFWMFTLLSVATYYSLTSPVNYESYSRVYVDAKSLEKASIKIDGIVSAISFKGYQYSADTIRVCKAASPINFDGDNFLKEAIQWKIISGNIELKYTHTAPMLAVTCMNAITQDFIDLVRQRLLIATDQVNSHLSINKELYRQIQCSVKTDSSDPKFPMCTTLYKDILEKQSEISSSLDVNKYIKIDGSVITVKKNGKIAQIFILSVILGVCLSIATVHLMKIASKNI